MVKRLPQFHDPKYLADIAPCRKTDDLSDDDRETLELIKELAEDYIRIRFKKQSELAAAILNHIWEDIDRNWSETWKNFYSEMISEKQFHRIRKEIERIVDEKANQIGAEGSISTSCSGRPKRAIMNEYDKKEVSLQTSPEWDEVVDELRKLDLTQENQIISQQGPIIEILERLKPVIKKLEKISFRGVELVAKESPEWPLVLYHFARYVVKDLARRQELLLLARSIDLKLNKYKNKDLYEIPVYAKCANELACLAIQESNKTDDPSVQKYKNAEAEVWLKEAQDASCMWPTVQYNRCCLLCIKAKQTSNQQEQENLKKQAFDALQQMCRLFLSGAQDDFSRKRLTQLMNLTFEKGQETEILMEDTHMKNSISELYKTTNPEFSKSSLFLKGLIIILAALCTFAFFSISRYQEVNPIIVATASEH